MVTKPKGTISRLRATANLSLLFGTVGACNAPQPREPTPIFQESSRRTCPGLYAQISNNPEADAQDRFRSGDKRYITTSGQGYGIAGLPKEAIDEAVARGRASIRTLEGLDDVIGPDTCFDFVMDAPEYNQRYNMEIWRLAKK
jgi:hypothetical protein